MYYLFANIDNRDAGSTSRHRTLRAAGKAYQAAHTGNMRRVINAMGNDVTGDACDAAMNNRAEDDGRYEAHTDTAW